MDSDELGLYNLTTAELAKLLHVKPQTIRKRYSTTGSYFGLRPIKSLNRYLFWPDNARAQLLHSDPLTAPPIELATAPIKPKQSRPAKAKAKPGATV